MKNSTKAIIIGLVLALVSCKKEDAPNPDTEAKICWECELIFVHTDEKTGLKDTLGQKPKYEFCDLSRLGIERKKVEFDKWTTIDGLRYKQELNCDTASYNKQYTLYKNIKEQ